LGLSRLEKLLEKTRTGTQRNSGHGERGRFSLRGGYAGRL